MELAYIWQTKTSNMNENEPKCLASRVAARHVPRSVNSWTTRGTNEIKNTMKMETMQRLTQSVTGTRLTHPVGKRGSVIGTFGSYLQRMVSCRRAPRLINTIMNI